MTQLPDFNDLTPPPELVRFLRERNYDWMADLATAYQAGAQHGWQQARQLWPTPITDRSPAKVDLDDNGQIQYVDNEGYWRVGAIAPPGWEGEAWQHTPRWRPPSPKPPTLKEQALTELDEWCKHKVGEGEALLVDNLRVELIRRALEGEEGEG